MIGWGSAAGSLTAWLVTWTLFLVGGEAERMPGTGGSPTVQTLTIVGSDTISAEGNSLARMMCEVFEKYSRNTNYMDNRKRSQKV